VGHSNASDSEFGTRRQQRSWFKACPKEEPMNHPLMVVRHGARRAPVIRNYGAGSGRVG
jgi:hypothetical protein